MEKISIALPTAAGLETLLSVQSSLWRPLLPKMVGASWATATDMGALLTPSTVTWSCAAPEARSEAGSRTVMDVSSPESMDAAIESKVTET